MTDRELNIALREMARSAGLCDAWYEEWKDNDTLDSCMERYIRGFDFVKNNDWPSLEFSREHFTKRIDLLHKHHIYFDEEVNITDVENGFYAFIGHCKAYMEVEGMKVVTIYCRHDSVVDVKATGGAIVFVKYYDQSAGITATDGFSKIRRYVYNTEKK